jgi:predicted amino acid-binding ACT domain protein
MTSGGDQLGLVARLSNVLAQYAANIVRPNASQAFR